MRKIYRLEYLDGFNQEVKMHFSNFRSLKKHYKKYVPYFCKPFVKATKNMEDMHDGYTYSVDITRKLVNLGKYPHKENY